MAGTVIVVGAGLAGLSAAHTALENGANVVVVERNLFMGGNSTKATSGMNGAGTRTQKAMNVPDSAETFLEDTVRGATGAYTGPWEQGKYGLANVLTGNSGAAIHWIQDRFGLALDTVSRLGGHSQPRTHRSKNGTTFPGMEITFALMKRYEELAESDPKRVQLITKARVHKLLTDGQGRVGGVVYKKDGVDVEVRGDAVVISTGGYGAGGLEKGSLLEQIRPDLCNLPTTNGNHCTGDGIQIAMSVGAGSIDLKHVQVHPTGLVHMDDPNNRSKFLAAEALRGEGALLLDRDGKRFANDLGTRDYVTMRMWSHNKPPYRLVLNKAGYSNIAWHCKHYCGRRVMKEYKAGAELAADIGISVAELEAEFQNYNNLAKNNNDPWGKKFFPAGPWTVNDSFMVAIVTPVVHYAMGGLEISPAAECVDGKSGLTKPGLFAAGEATGGVHGRNRLGGSALLECVVFGRVAGASATSYIKSGRSANPKKVERVTPLPDSQVSTIPPPHIAGKGVPDEEKGVAAGGAGKLAKGDYSLEEVAKHNKDNDCWVVVNGKVLDVTGFLEDHPGGKMAIMTFAGRDATEEFNMVHEEGTLEKYAKEFILGDLKPKAKL